MNDYYGELCTQMYETNKSIAGAKELEFYLSFVSDEKMKVLEPMCGNGRMLIPFMERGIDIEGFDISEEMLRLCKMKGQKLNLKPTVFYSKLEEFESTKSYDLIIIPFGSFSLLPDELVKASLTNMRAALNEDGKMLLTVMTNKGPIEGISDWIETNRQLVDNKEIIEYKKLYFDEKSNLLNTTLKYHLVVNGEITKEELMDFPVRLYEDGEFETILKTNGFEKFSLHEVTDGYDVGSSFQVFECVK